MDPLAPIVRSARRRRRTMLSWMWPCVLGCFDVREVPVALDDETRPPPLLIDDFEDGDPRPSAESIEPWRCSTYNPGPGLQPVACGPAAEGYRSDRGYSLWFELSDSPDGVNDFPVAELFAPTSVPVDISLYAELRFSARYSAGDVPLPAAAYLQVSFSCFDDDEDPQSLDNAVPLSTSWQSQRLPLANFAQPDWQTNRMDAAVCAARVSALSFDIAGFSDGQAATGTLLVDDVYLR